MVDERHDRSSPARRGGGIRGDRDAGRPGVAQGVGVGHGRCGRTARPVACRASARWRRGPSGVGATVGAPGRSAAVARRRRALGAGGRGGPAGGGRAAMRRGVDLDRVLDVGRGLAELADALAERGPDVRQLARAEDQQRDDEDDDRARGVRVSACWQIGSSEGVGRWRSRVAQGVARPTRGGRARRARPGLPDAVVQGRPGDAPRDVDEQAAAGPAAGRRGRAPDRRRGPAPTRRPGRRRPGRGTARPGRSPGSSASSAGAVAPTTRPTVPPGPQSRRRRATRSCRRSAGAPVAGSAATTQVLQLAGARVGGAAQDVGEPVERARGAARWPSSPRYGLTVTASAPRASKRATAWRAAVDPMSPRFASAMTGTSAGMRRPEPLEGGQPGGAERLEEREVRLDRRGERERPPR